MGGWVGRWGGAELLIASQTVVCRVEGWRGGGVEGCMALHVWFVGLFDRKRVELGELRHGRDGA